MKNKIKKLMETNQGINYAMLLKVCEPRPERLPITSQPSVAARVARIKRASANSRKAGLQQGRIVIQENP